MFCSSNEATNIYLLLPVPESVLVPYQSSPTKIWVSHLRGLPRSTKLISELFRHFGTFIPNLTISNDLGYFGAVSLKLPRVIFSSSANTIVITDYVSMDFPLHY